MILLAFPPRFQVAVASPLSEGPQSTMLDIKLPLYQENKCFPKALPVDLC